MEDYKTSQETLKTLQDVNIRYIQEYHSFIDEIQKGLLQLITLYPEHIKTEDTQFFFPAMDYFISKERDTILQEFFDSDKNIIHEHYSILIEKQEKKIIINIS